MDFLPKKKRQCGIYKIQNKINNKIYIGQAVCIADRFYDHKQGYGIPHNSVIDLAIKVHGVDNFTFEVIKECPREELNYWENYYADLYNCYVPNGYNINKCGQAFHNVSRDKEISCYDLTGQLITTYASTHEAERITGYCRQGFTAAANNKRAKTAYNMYWAWGHAPHINVIKPKAGVHGGKDVYQYDINTGDYIQTFKSLADAERSLHKDGGNKNISAVCLGKRKSAYGFLWSYNLYNNILKEKKV